MQILFILSTFFPSIGGVERHVLEVTRLLTKKGYKITVLVENHGHGLRDIETIDSILVQRFNYPKIKYLGLLYIWFWLFKNRKLIEDSDMVHCHDVFIWYLPFCFLYPSKPIYTTMHGWEGKYPIPWINIFFKKLASFFSRKVIAVGHYIEKYYGIKADLITYGAVNTKGAKQNHKKIPNTIVFLGRLEADTGLFEFLNYLNTTTKHKIVYFCGDGSLKNECSKYGQVLGFVDPQKYLQISEVCVPGGYLSAMEAITSGCTLRLFWPNKLKEDYWKLSPFKQLKGRILDSWVTNQTWAKLASQYIDLWTS